MAFVLAGAFGLYGLLKKSFAWGVLVLGDGQPVGRVRLIWAARAVFAADLAGAGWRGRAAPGGVRCRRGATEARDTIGSAACSIQQEIGSSLLPGSTL